jgi:hypothetical protein
MNGVVINHDKWFARVLNRLRKAAQLLKCVRVNCEDRVKVIRLRLLSDFEAQVP